jgi:hypothetical protein
MGMERATKRISKFMLVDTPEQATATAKISKFELEKLIGAPEANVEDDSEWISLDDWTLEEIPESLDSSLLVAADTEPPPAAEGFSA